MILMKPSVELLFGPIGLDDPGLQLIEQAGRTCYLSEKGEITRDTARAFAQKLIDRGHESVIEHVSFTVRFICDRGVSHEIVRHRLASYSQESTRYCDYNKAGQVTFILPPWVHSLVPGEYGFHSDFAGLPETDMEWVNSMLLAEASYQRLRKQGWNPEQARSVLPNSLKTTLVMTANLREWKHFLELRTGLSAHPQMREVAVPLLVSFKLCVPVIFDDILCDD